MKQPIKLMSPKAAPINKLLTLAGKVMAKTKVRKFTLRVGTKPGKWDIFNGELSKKVKDMTVTPLTGNPPKLFAELSYPAPKDQGAARRDRTPSTNSGPAQPHPRHHEENILHGEKPIEITLV
jgi:hypothetical protein